MLTTLGDGLLAGLGAIGTTATSILGGVVGMLIPSPMGKSTEWEGADGTEYIAQSSAFDIKGTRPDGSTVSLMPNGQGIYVDQGIPVAIRKGDKVLPFQRVGNTYIATEPSGNTIVWTPDQSGEIGSSSTRYPAQTDPFPSSTISFPSDIGANSSTSYPIYDDADSGIYGYPADSGVGDLGAVYNQNNDSDLTYSASPKHAKGGWGTYMDLDDDTAQRVLNESIQGGKQRYSYYDGKVYEFQPDNTGTWHGYPIPGNEAPASILRSFRDSGKISNSEYNKLLKGK
ncbi:S-type pyocin domain-containing protein [Pokkaliibacter sp. MBI-7]|uniref:S-type pyocin domain-containing protein n=1 Tax=Pokkaliibacter sp. MBI-7 TaxID=3040600 RepID=UPI00244BAF8B|nr:S-type pyocin domain-containing protein [Pokkaliibacter sp. MBI-7]MDH2433499.1 S-type pyocin domain-containing protein [Pokkaliibacter sp. MBI-7]